MEPRARRRLPRGRRDLPLPAPAGAGRPERAGRGRDRRRPGRDGREDRGDDPDRFAYRSGATTVDSSLSDLLAAGAGVCQDFAHLALALLRELDIGARYVSGYFFTIPEGADPSESSTEVQTHAWVEALLPVAGGGDPVWFGVDPTNRLAAGERHVKIGHGRMYADVPPIEGSFSGAASSEIDAHVRMRALPQGEHSGSSLSALPS